MTTTIIEKHQELRKKRIALYVQRTKYQTFVSFTTIMYTLMLLYTLSLRLYFIQDYFMILVGLYVGDLVTGMIHIYLDHKKIKGFSPIDKMAFSFQYSHHKYPHLFYKDQQILGTTSQIKITFGLGVPVFLLTYFFASNTNLAIILYIMNISAVWSQIIHACSHMMKKKTPSIILVLRKLNLCLKQSTHRDHHKKQYATNFSIVNGWSNPLLNRLYKYVFHPIMKNLLYNHFEV